MGILDEILQNYARPLTAFFSSMTALVIAILVFREQFVRLLAMLPQPLVDLLSRITVLRVAIGRFAFQTEFGQRVKRAKDRAKGLQDTVAASRSMPAPNRMRDAGTQSTRDLVLAAWGALQQIVYDASSASNLPLTPATRIPEAVRRLAEAHAIDAELASLIDVLYNLGQRLADDIGLRPLEDDARIYTQLADLVVDWMMINVLSRRKEEEAKRREDPKPRAKTMVGGHFPLPQIGFPVAVLMGIGGPVRGQRFSVEKEYYRIGSNADNDLRISGDAYVSGNHAALRYEQGSLFLADQGSRNGSFVNDKRVAGSPVAVRWGDHLRLGESVFQVAEEQVGRLPKDEARETERLHQTDSAYTHEGDEPPTSTLQWNTGFPHDATAEKVRVLFVGMPYLLRTAIQAGENTIGSLTPGGTVQSPGEEYLEVTAEGERFFTVWFGIRVTGAVVQPSGGGLQSCSEAMSGVLRCVIGRGTPPFDLDLTATAAGPISVELTLYVKGGATLRRLLALTAVDLTGGEQLAMSELLAAETAQLGSGGSPLSSLQSDDPGGPRSPTFFRAVASSVAPAASAAPLEAPPRLDTAMLPVQNLLHLRPTAVCLGVSFREGNYWVELLIDPARSDLVCVASAEEVLVNTVITLRNELIQLSTAYRAAPAHAEDLLAGLRILEPADALLSFARIGARLHRALFGRRGDQAISPALHTMAATIAQLGRGAGQPPRMQIDAEFLPIPWAIIYDGPEPKTATEVDLEAFWGVRFQIDRVARVTLTELAPDSAGAGPRRVIACLNPNLDAEQKIAVLQSQRAFFQGTPVLATLIESGAGLKAFLQAMVDEAPCNFLYFFCHATAAQTLNRNLFRDPTSPSDAATIELDKPPISVEQLCDIRIKPLPAQPLVFMNTCSSAQGDSVFQSVFLTHFFGTWRASGVIGTDWTLPTVFADGFARLFLKHFLIDRQPVADAFHGAARKALELGNPFPLIYALYVRPDYTL